MATATKTAKGFKAPCPRCSETETVSIDLADLETCHCSSCDAEFTITEVREMLSAWVAICNWIDMAPATE